MMESNISTIISEDLITYSRTNSPRNLVLLDLYTSTVLSLLALMIKTFWEGHHRATIVLVQGRPSGGVALRQGISGAPLVSNGLIS
jgi:hypothetical protein